MSEILRSLRWMLLAGLVFCMGDQPVSRAIAAEGDSSAQRFAAADSNGDKQLSLEEFLKLAGEPAVLKRDFNLFDFDGDGTLSPGEFDAVPLGRPAKDRGALPDPLQDVVELAVAQMDETYNGWDDRPNQQIPVNEFVNSFALSFPDPNAVLRYRAGEFREADPDGNQRVSREEARRFLEIQLGIRRSDGELLRFPNAQVVNYSVFVSLDENKDLAISRNEFFNRWWHKDKLDGDWQVLDQDRDGTLTYDEFLNPGWHGTIDIVEQFRWYDSDLDAFVDKKELLARSPEWSQSLARHAFPGFDLDRDGKLNLAEFRMLPQSNLIHYWNAQMVDANRDGVISFTEFAELEGHFPLMRLLFFLRFDVDRNGTLDPMEFEFKELPLQSLYRMNADGSEWKLVFQSRDYPQVGSPKISPDGKWLACDVVERGNEGNNRTMLVMTVDGKDVRKLTAGMMPNWSPDGKQLAFSWGGIQTFDLATNQSKTLVRNGWSAQWSPDGEKIAFTERNAIKTIDPQTEEVTVVLSAEESPYQQIYWNFGWSPDGRQICFKGLRPGGAADVATVRLDDPPGLKVHYQGASTIGEMFAWSPDGSKIVFPLHTAEKGKFQMYEFDPRGSGDPKPLKVPDTSIATFGACWSPDGRFLILSTVPE